MAKLTREELLDKIKSVIGENTDDAALALLEDATDTLTGEEDAGEVEKLKKQLADNDKMWRERYRDRFMNPPKDDSKPPSPDNGGEDDDKEEKPIQVDDLFGTDEKGGV